jgi:hypothetical protein
VDPVSLTVGGVVAALVLKAADKTGEQLAGSGLAAVGRLVERVRRQFQERGDAAAQAVLARVQDPPVAEAHISTLAAAVDRHAGEDAAFAVELACLVQEGHSAGVEVHHVSQQMGGSGGVQIAQVHTAQITVVNHGPAQPNELLQQPKESDKEPDIGAVSLLTQPQPTGAKRFALGPAGKQQRAR